MRLLIFLDKCSEVEKQRVDLYTASTESFISGREEGWNTALSLYMQYQEKYVTTDKKDVGLELMIKQCKNLLQSPPEIWHGGIILEEK